MESTEELNHDIKTRDEITEGMENWFRRFREIYDTANAFNDNPDFLVIDKESADMLSQCINAFGKFWEHKINVAVVERCGKSQVQFFHTHFMVIAGFDNE